MPGNINQNIRKRSKHLSWIHLLFGFFLFTFLAFHSGNSAFAKNLKYASIVIDADTGVVLHQRHADKKLHPASLTKMMTLLMVFEALENRKIDLNSRVRISNKAAQQIPSKIGLKAGSSIRMEDAIYSLVTKSANDIAVAVAEHLGGSESRFASQMTNRAKQIGLTRTVFRNASGLHDPRQISTARDMAKLGRYLLKRYPHYYKYFSTRNFMYQGKNYHNHNRLIGTYNGMDGIKTGYINASGFNLVASAKRGNTRLIGVVFGGRSSVTRNNHMVKLLDNGFKKLGHIRMASAKMPLPEKKPLSVRVAQADLMKAEEKEFARMASINPQMRKGFSELIGEGDFDPALSKRLETGLLAVAVHKGEYEPDVTATKKVVSKQQPRNPALYSNTTTASALRDVRSTKYNMFSTQAPLQKAAFGANGSAVNNSAVSSSGANAGRNGWTVQIGAYADKRMTDRALDTAQKRLPGSLRYAAARTYPFKTSRGMMYRARLTGFTEAHARQACLYFPECIVINPRYQ